MKRAKRTPALLAASDVPESFAPVVTAFAKRRGVSCERGWGAGNVVLKVDGRMFAMLVKGNFVGKLPRSRVDALVEDGTGERFDPGHGRVMKEWICVRPKAASWVELAQEANDFVKANARAPRASSESR